MARDLGAMGEDCVKLWCSQVGIAANKSTVDKWGWDFLLEFPHEEDSHNYSLDMRECPIKCKVQVKSTDGRERNNQIEVSNLENLVKTPEPAFICFLEFDAEDAPQRAYLVHIGEGEICKILKKIRELESKGKKKLHAHKITIKYGREHKISSLNGSGFSREIKKYIPDGMGKYLIEKQEYIKEVGFENGRKTFTITVDRENAAKLIDATLGSANN